MQNGGFVNKIQVVRLSVAKIHRHVFENPGYMVAGWAGAKVTGALGTAVAPGVGTLVGAGAGFVVGVALYTATDVVTINDYTLREHAQYTLDEGVEDLKKWITDNIPLLQGD